MERGDYRPVHKVIKHSPEFLALSGYARGCWLMIKLELGPYGIGYYSFEQLVRESGFDAPHVARALKELCAEPKPWLYVEGGLWWLRNGWRFERHNNPDNKNNREGALKHLRGLPKQPLVSRFAKYYGLPLPFVLPEVPGEVPGEDRGEVLPEVLPEVVGEDRGEHRDREQKTETEKESPPISPSRGKEQGEEAAPRRGARTIPKDYAPGEGHLALALSLGQDLDLCVDEMRDWALAKRSLRHDWDAVLRNWIRRRAQEQARWRKPGDNGVGSTPIGTLSSNKEMKWDGTRWRPV